MKNYIDKLREKVGHQNIILNFAVGIIFNSEGKILLQKRGDSQKWGLPGGAVELDESFDETVQREVFEETGLKIKIKKLLGVYSGKKYQEIIKNCDEYQPVVVAFYAEVIEGEQKLTDNDETLSLKYYSKDQLPEIHNKQHKDMISDAFNNKFGTWK